MVLPIDQIIADCRSAAVAFAPSSSTSRMEWVEKRIRKYEKALGRIVTAPHAKQAYFADQLIFNSASVRMLALMRSYAKRNQYPNSLQLQAAARALSLGKPTYEATLVKVIFPDGKPKPRFILEVGRIRTAKSIVLRDYMLALGLAGENDYALKGKGGVRGLIQTIASDMVTGYTTWSCPDITNYYLSLRREHFQGLPIKDSVIKNVAFLPEGKLVVVYKPEDQKALAKYLADAVPSNSPNDASSLTSAVTKMVRQSLPLGLPASSLLASWFIQSVLAANIVTDVKSYAYADNLALGAKSKSEAKIAIDAVVKAFAQHPAGPIGLHDTQVTSSKNTATLGYEFIPGKGYGGNKVHIKPNHQSFERLKRKLGSKLDGANADDVPGLFEVAELYATNWFASKNAWTKVPALSWEACLNSTYSYVSDWKAGIPMGTKKLNIPQHSLAIGKKVAT